MGGQSCELLLREVHFFWGLLALGVVMASFVGVDGRAWNDLSPEFGVRRERAMEADQMQPGHGTSAARRCRNSSGDMTMWVVPPR